MLQPGAVDFINICHIADTGRSQLFLVDLDIPVTGTSVCDVNVDVDYF